MYVLDSSRIVHMLQICPLLDIWAYPVVDANEEISTVIMCNTSGHVNYPLHLSHIWDSTHVQHLSTMLTFSPIL